MRRLFLLLALMASVSMRAEDFKILFLNTESIKIGKTVCVVGDTFNDSEKIFWKDGKQAIKVMSLDTKKQYVLVSEDFKQRKMKSAKDFIIKNNRLSTRGIGNLSAVARQIGDKIYWVDPIIIDVAFKPEKGEYYYLVIDLRKHILEYSDGHLVFDSGIWGDSTPTQETADLFFHFSDGSDELVSSEIEIVPLPNEVILKGRRRHRKG